MVKEIIEPHLFTGYAPSCHLLSLQIVGSNIKGKEFAMKASVQDVLQLRLDLLQELKYNASNRSSLQTTQIINTFEWVIFKSYYFSILFNIVNTVFWTIEL